MMGFQHPILLLLIFPAFGFTLSAAYRWGIPNARPTTRVPRIASRLLPAMAGTLLALAASGPEWRTPLRGSAPVVDFAVVLDSSSSMKALDDGREDRWTSARRLLKAFIAGRPDDRFSLILFSAHPATLTPLTPDHARLLTMLDQLTLDIREDGTAIGSALMTAVRRLSGSPARSRVILLLTDGIQNRGRVTPLEAAEEARRQGIRIHTIALGGSETCLYPLEGGGFAKINVASDPATLQAVARQAGGEALAAQDPAGLTRSLAAINHLEKTTLPVDPPRVSQPLASWCLASAALLVLPLLLDLARKRGRPRPSWLTEP